MNSAESLGTLGAGQAAEQLAEQFLAAKGLRLIRRNFRCKCGEIDLIMRDGHCVVFIEVRYRATSVRGSAAESVTAAKRRRIVNTALVFMQQYDPGHDRAYRFDVVALAGPLSTPRIDWISPAF